MLSVLFKKIYLYLYNNSTLRKVPFIINATSTSFIVKRNPVHILIHRNMKQKHVKKAQQQNLNIKFLSNVSHSIFLMCKTNFTVFLFLFFFTSALYRFGNKNVCGYAAYTKCKLFAYYALNITETKRKSFTKPEISVSHCSVLVTHYGPLCSNVWRSQAILQWLAVATQLRGKIMHRLADRTFTWPSEVTSI